MFSDFIIQTQIRIIKSKKYVKKKKKKL